MDGPEAARAAVAALGATLVRRRHFEDNVLYDDARLALAPGRRCACAGGRARVVTFKGRAQDARRRQEPAGDEVEVSDGERFHAILTALGYVQVFRYQKYRETYRWREVEIVIDETPIGTFLEIEGRSRVIHAAAARARPRPADYIADSYAALFFASGGTGDMVFP
jgi:adenylate cyclase class 2